MGVVHSDLEQENVLVDEAHEPILADMGSAGCLNEDGQVRGMEGSLAYMVPKITEISIYDKRVQGNLSRRSKPMDHVRATQVKDSHGFFKVCDRHRLILDLARKIRLKYISDNWRHLSRNDIWDLVRAIFEDSPLHRVVDWDLKAENILVFKAGIPIIADMGCTTRTNADGKLETPEYIAPEISRTSIYTKLVDSFSLGILLYGLLVCKLPELFKTTSKYINKIKKWGHAKELVDGLLCPTAATRLTIALRSDNGASLRTIGEI
ncbi:hypothetical protein BGW39_001772 [Mortierella sp. 14UC]|nr:hypothetical protein BGW39_001772 [Mortierella sp. 14UC]